MKHVVHSILASLFSVSLLAGCGATTSLLNASAPSNTQVSSFAKQQALPTNTRSNAGLDTISKRMRIILFNQIDTNHDGIVGKHEVSFLPADFYASIDKDHDGMWESAEFANYTGPSTPPYIVPTRDVLRQMAQVYWNTANADHNTVVTLDELLRTFHTPPSPPAPCPPGGSCTPPSQSPSNPFADQDALRKATEAFNNADKNLDHKLNASEFEDMMALHLLNSSESPSMPLHPIPAPPAPNHPPCNPGDGCPTQPVPNHPPCNPGDGCPTQPAPAQPPCHPGDGCPTPRAR